MTLEDFFASLSYGPLSNLAIGMEGGGTIAAASQNRLTTQVNHSLLKIYSRFLILEKEVVIEADANKTIYPLDPKYADSAGVNGETKHIVDTAGDPFIQDIIKILKIYDMEGEELALNDLDNEDSLFTPDKHTVQIPKPVDEALYYVLYQAQHPLLAPNDLTQELIIPEEVEEALLHDVAARVFGPMNGEEHMRRAAEHRRLYTAATSELTALDTLGSSLVNSTTRFEDKGFV